MKRLEWIKRGITDYKSHTGVSYVGYFLTMGFLVGLLVFNSVNLGYNWQWYRVPGYLLTVTEEGLKAGRLLSGLLITLKISIAGTLLAVVFGLAAALLKLSDSIVGKVLAGLYIEAIRNTPLLIQLLLIYFVLAPIFGIGPFMSAVLALGLFEGAYISEIIRGGILAVEEGQWEASSSLGMSRPQTYLLIILPQAIRLMIPPLAGQIISLVKDSALVSVIAIYDLTMEGQAIVSETFLVFEIWFTVAAIYLSITASFSFLVHWFENRSKTR